MSQQREYTFAHRMDYLLYLPDIEAPGKGFPLMLFLHGGGERGTDLDLIKKHGPPSFLDERTDFPFLVISPQCPEEETWDPLLLLALINEISGVYFVDTNRIYVTGLSMGGTGTWDLAMAAPDKLAAIAPICGEAQVSRACEIKSIPTWVFHGAKDEVVPPSFSDKMVEALQQCGADVKYSLYEDVDHFAWVPAYRDPAFYEWMQSQKKE